MAVFDRQTRNRKVFHPHKQNSDIPPVSMLRLTGFSGICAVGAFAEDLAAVSGGTGIVCTLKKNRSNSPDMDIFNGLNVVNAHSGVGGTDEVVAALIGKFDFAVFKDQSGILRNGDGTIQQPVSAVTLFIGLTAGDMDDSAARCRRNCLFDLFAVAAVKLIWSDMVAHCCTLYFTFEHIFFIFSRQKAEIFTCIFTCFEQNINGFYLRFTIASLLVNSRKKTPADI